MKVQGSDVCQLRDGSGRGDDSASQTNAVTDACSRNLVLMAAGYAHNIFEESIVRMNVFDEVWSCEVYR